MTLLIPTDATHMLNGVFYRLPRIQDSGLPLLFWGSTTAMWHKVSAEATPGLMADLIGNSVAFTRQY